MSTWLLTIGVVLFGWIALTGAAAAQSAAAGQDTPLGDVWITSGEAGTHQRIATDDTAAAKSDVLTGDVWIAPDEGGRAQAARPPNPRERTSKNAMTGSIDERPTGP